MPGASGIGQKIMVIGVTIVALFAALIVVPPLARQVGLFEKHVGYATVGAVALVVAVAVRWFKSLNDRPPDVSPPVSKSRRRRR